MNGNGAAVAGFVPPLPPTILVIDDDAAMGMILGITLRAFGYLAFVAGDGEEALRVARDHPEIRIILLDVVMPGLSGRELADQLRSNLPNAAILFCSGHPPELMSLHGIDLTCVEFMQKPCRPPELKRKVEELLATA
jgi:two-component system cell cycle sensor histidine kinase/response regulator CckA